MKVNGELQLSNFLFVNNRVNFNASMIGGILKIQEVINYDAEHKIFQEILLYRKVSVFFYHGMFFFSYLQFMFSARPAGSPVNILPAWASPFNCH